MQTSNDYLAKIDFWSLEEEIRGAVRLAMWLVVDKKSALKRAVKIACKKHGGKQNKTEAAIKDALPANFFKKRAKENMTPEMKEIFRAQAITKYNANKSL